MTNEGKKAKSMSRQLQISSLFSALAMVSLCLTLSVRDYAAELSASEAVTAQAETLPGLNALSASLTD